LPKPQTTAAKVARAAHIKRDTMTTNDLMKSAAELNEPTEQHLAAGMVELTEWMNKKFKAMELKINVLEQTIKRLG
jgi:hypothetical protein